MFRLTTIAALLALSACSGNSARRGQTAPNLDASPPLVRSDSDLLAGTQPVTKDKPGSGPGIGGNGGSGAGNAGGAGNAVNVGGGGGGRGAAVPEPATMLLVGTGLAGAALARRRRRTVAPN